MQETGSPGGGPNRNFLLGPPAIENIHSLGCNRVHLYLQVVIGPWFFDPKWKRVLRQNRFLKRGKFAVKKNRFAVEQIVGILKRAGVGVPVAELIRTVGISEQTFYRWKKQSVGPEIDQLRQFKQLQEQKRLAG